MKIAPYSAAMETLESVVEGLDVNESANALAIAGSGDQAFAILTRAGYVLAVDVEDIQIEYVLARIDALKRGDIDEFLPEKDPSICKQNNRAYLTRRFEALRAKADRIDVRKANIFKINPIGFNKIYLSNALGYEGNILSELQHLGELAAPGTLIFSENDEVDATMQERITVIKGPDGKEMSIWLIDVIPKELIIHETRTYIARSLEVNGWGPVIYQKP